MIGAHWLKREVVFVGVCGGGEVALTGHQALRLHTERKMKYVLEWTSVELYTYH